MASMYIPRIQLYLASQSNITCLHRFLRCYSNQSLYQSHGQRVFRLSDPFVRRWTGSQSTTQSTSQSVPESIPPPFNKWIASGVLVGGLIAFGMYFPQPGPLVMDLANSNEELTSLIGIPIRRTLFWTGHWNRAVSGLSVKSAALSIPVEGSIGAAILHVRALYLQGKWEIVICEAEIPGNELKPISLIKSTTSQSLTQSTPQSTTNCNCSIAGASVS